MTLGNILTNHGELSSFVKVNPVLTCVINAYAGLVFVSINGDTYLVCSPEMGVCCHLAPSASVRIFYDFNFNKGSRSTWIQYKDKSNGDFSIKVSNLVSK